MRSKVVVIRSIRSSSSLVFVAGEHETKQSLLYCYFAERQPRSPDDDFSDYDMVEVKLPEHKVYLLDAALRLGGKDLKEAIEELIRASLRGYSQHLS